MRTIIVYPLPLDNWVEFYSWWELFLNTFKENTPGCDYELLVVCNWGEPTDTLREMTFGTKRQFISYYGNGCDAGSWKLAASEPVNHDAFLICMTSRCYFHRPEWLKRIVFEREKYGPGLYTTSASYEGGRLHACLRCFGIDSVLLREYPMQMQTRDEGVAVEVGINNPIGSLGEWVENKGKALKLVTWDGCYDKADWFKVPNRFRDGDQSNMLVFDKHSDEYRNASPEDKRHLEQLCNPK